MALDHYVSFHYKVPESKDHVNNVEVYNSMNNRINQDIDLSASGLAYIVKNKQLATHTPQVVTKENVPLQCNLMDCGWHVLRHMHFAMNIVQFADLNTHIHEDMIDSRATIIPFRILRLRKCLRWRKFLTEDTVDPTHDECNTGISNQKIGCYTTICCQKQERSTTI
jgi:Ulp1 family protease